MHSTHEATLAIPGLPSAATKAHIVPELSTHSLLSLGQLCDAGCQVSLNQTAVQVHYNKELVLAGDRCPITKLWQMNLPAPHQALAAIGSATPADIVAFHHASLGSPSLRTLEKALSNGILPPLPGLTAQTLRKYPPISLAMHKGHMKALRQGVQSTKPTPEELAAQQDELDTVFPHQEGSVSTDQFCFAAFFQPTGKIFTDQTGKIFEPSSNGNQYIMVLYCYDSNYIWLEPFKNRTAACILATYKILLARLKTAGIKAKLQRLDNECSQLLKDYMSEEKIDFQLVGHGMHRRNPAECAIGTFENHFVSILCGLDKRFPLHLWDKLIPQTELTLNMLRGSRLNPKLSAYTQIHGIYDINRSPLAPLGIRVLAHVPASDHGNVEPRAVDGWYIGAARESYRGHLVYVWQTHKIRTCFQLAWFPTKITMPLASSSDLIHAAIQDIVQAIKNPQGDHSLAPLSPSNIQALELLSNLYTDQQIKPTDKNTTDTSPANPIPLLRVPTISPSKPPPGFAPILRVANTITPANPLQLPTTAPTARTSTDQDTATYDGPPDLATYDAITGPRRRKAKRGSPKAPLIAPTAPTTIPSIACPSIAEEPLQAELSHLPTLDKQRERLNAKLEAKRGSRLLRAPPPPPPPRKQLYQTKPIQRPLSEYKRYDTRSSTRGKAIVAMAAYNKANATHYFKTGEAPRLAHVRYALLGSAVNPDTNRIAEYRELATCSEGADWEKSMCDELARLSQGFGDTAGTNTIRFIDFPSVPPDKKATYARLVAAWRPEKTNPRRVRITVGGDRIFYDGATATKAADLTTVKTLLNSVLSTPGARFATADIKDFYLNTPMHTKEYMQMALSLIPKAFRDYYQLDKIAHNGKVYMEIAKGMYGLPQAGRLAHDLLVERLAKHGYKPAPITPGLWRHESRPIAFTLVVDDFGIKYINDDDLNHLLAALKDSYQISVDLSGQKYCGLDIAWDYNARTCDISMPGYIERALERFQHSMPTKPQSSPHEWQKPVYGTKQQFAPADDESTPLSATETTRIQEVMGVLLYYARAVDSTLLVALNTIASQQAAPTHNTMRAVTQVLDYCTTHPDAIVRYKASEMVLWQHSDASYLSAPKARSRAGGFHFLSDWPETNLGPDSKPPMINGAVNVLCQIMREVLSSAAEAELGGLFHNAKEACPLRILLDELGHPQPATPLQTDNVTAAGIANDTVKQRRSKAIDMRFYWLRDRVEQGQFNIYWSRGAGNFADYFTKHHPASHHQAIRSVYLHNDKASHNYFELLADEASA